MRRTLLAPALLTISSLLGGCRSEPQGELLLVIQTDLALPKDIDAIRIEAWTEGVPKFKNDYTRLGTTDGQIHLPGTLGLLAPDKADAAVKVTVSARTGGSSGKARVVRDIVTTVPLESTVTLPLPIEFLCDGQVDENDSGDATSSCPGDLTCIAGTCESPKVDSTDLPPYDEAQVYGDGTCFDAAKCWTEPEVASLDLGTCTIPEPAGDMNVALQTEGVGICGPVGCFVTLDAGSKGGWQPAGGGRVSLPPAVCDQVKAGKIVNVVYQPAGAGCAQKTPTLPTCGPWSAASENPPPYSGPTALAGGQPLPQAVQAGGPGLVWINAGLPGAQGSLKAVGKGGGVPKTLTTQSAAPRALALSLTDVFWTEAPGASGAGQVLKVDAAGKVTPLVQGLDVPEGIAVAASRLFWCDYQNGAVFSAALDGTGAKQLATGNYPYRLAADARYVYWTNEGTASTTPPDGSVQRVDHTAQTPTAEVVAPTQATPRAIALQVDASGVTRAVWWTSFASAGAIWRAVVGAGGALGAPEAVATGLSYPNGIAVDLANVYWTDRLTGKVEALPLAAKAGDAPKLIADTQLAPGAITVDEEAVYWVNEGTSSAPGGAVVRLPK